MATNEHERSLMEQLDLTVAVAREHIQSLMGQLGDAMAPLEALRMVSDARFELELLEEHHVDRARDQGASWGDVARVIGYTRQGAWKKHAAREL